MEGPYVYKALVRRVVDADTLVCDVSLGFQLWTLGESVRLLGVDAPEMSTPAGKVARAAVVALLAPGGPEAAAPWTPGLPVTMRTTKAPHADHFGRYLAEVVLADGTNLSAWLLTQGLAVPFMV